MSAPVTRRRALAASAAAALGFGAGVAPALAAPATPPVSTEAKTLQAELAYLSSTYRRACREADDTLAATADIDPPEALFTRAGDMQALFGRFPVKSWAAPERHWYGDRELVEKLRSDPFRYLDGSPSKGAARRDEIVAAWDEWKAAERAAEDASGHTAAQERFEAAFYAYAAFRTRLVEIRTEDPEVLTVKALAIADLIRGDSRGLGRCIDRALDRDCGPYEDALALSLVRDFLGLMGTGVVS